MTIFDFVYFLLQESLKIPKWVMVSHNSIKVVSYLWKLYGFHRVLRLPLTLTLTATKQQKILSIVAFNSNNHNSNSKCIYQCTNLNCTSHFIFLFCKCEDTYISYIDCCSTSNQQYNKNVDIKFSVHDVFLEYPSSSTLKAEIFESQIILKSLGERKPKVINRIAKIDQVYE